VINPTPAISTAFRLPLEVWAADYADAQERLLQTVQEALAAVLAGQQLGPKEVRLEVITDSVHGPSHG
jgi:hypothetical protein